MLASERQTGGMGVARLTRQQIRDWAEDEGHILEPWEKRTIMQIDALFVASCCSDAVEGS